MVNYFRCVYDQVGAYSPGWYGTRDKAPINEVFYYDDDNRIFVGAMNDPLPPDVIPMTAQEVVDFLQNAVDSPNVYFGQELEDRWKFPPEPPHDENGDDIIIGDNNGG